MAKHYLICCEIIRREIEYLLGQKKPDHSRWAGARRRHSGFSASATCLLPSQICFLRKGYHENPAQLREEVQKAIDAAPADVEVILTGYGLCGKGLEGVKARSVPLVIPRVHDCISLLMGSAKAYEQHFNANPGTYYYSPGWVEWGKDAVERAPAEGCGLGKSFEEYAAKYGEENARYLTELESSWVSHYSQAVYIDTAIPDDQGWEERARELASENGLKLQRISGSLRLLRMLLEGPWPEDEFLTVPPGGTIIATNDPCIVRCKALTAG